MDHYKSAPLEFDLRDVTDGHIVAFLSAPSNVPSSTYNICENTEYRKCSDL